MIRIDKTAPRWDISMHAGGHTFKAGYSYAFSCHIHINYIDNRSVDSGLGWARNVTGNNGAPMGGDVYFGGLADSLTTTDEDIFGSWGGMYVQYGFTICDVAGNCATHGRTTGYC